MSAFGKAPLGKNNPRPPTDKNPVPDLPRTINPRTPRPARPRRGAFAMRLLSLTAGLALPACAHVPTDPAAHAEYEQNNDPAEPINRVIFAGNKFVDDNAMKPVARGYKSYVPGRVRHGIHNFVGNLGEPSVAVNDVLQGNLGRAWNTTQRFAINTTVGGAGLFDVATGWDRPGHEADFGQTLGVWRRPRSKRPATAVWRVERARQRGQGRRSRHQSNNVHHWRRGCSCHASQQRTWSRRRTCGTTRGNRLPRAQLARLLRDGTQRHGATSCRIRGRGKGGERYGP